MYQVLNKFLWFFYKIRIARSFVEKANRLKSKTPSKFSVLNKEQLSLLRSTWKGFDRYAFPWVSHLAASSGKFCSEFIDEAVFFSTIEPLLNDLNTSPFYNSKANLSLFAGDSSPRVLGYYRSGRYYCSGRYFSADEFVNEIGGSIKGNSIVIKKSNFSSGGAGVFKVKADEIIKFFKTQHACCDGAEFVIQELIETHESISKYNTNCINTLRLMTYRCQKSGTVFPIKSMFRMGATDDFRDNMMLGGLCVCLDKSGKFGDLAYDYDGNSFEAHPSSGIDFSKETLYGFDCMVSLALSIASKILDMDLLSFDLVVDIENKPRCIEINSCGQGITQLQFDGNGLFGEFHSQIVDLVNKGSNFNSFDVLRKIYW